MRTQEKFTSIAFTLGMISVITASSLIGGLLFGSLAIVFAELSKGSSTKLNRKSKLALEAGVVGIVLAIGATYYNIYQYLHNPEFKHTVDMAFNQMYGVNCDQFFIDIFNSFRGN